MFPRTPVEPARTRPVRRSMLSRMRRHLTRMKADPAGTRFVHEHQRVHDEGMPTAVRVAYFALAFIFSLIGVVLVFTPGPAFVFFLLAGPLLATQWRPLAVVLDRTELWTRKTWRRIRPRLRFTRLRNR